MNIIKSSDVLENQRHGYVYRRLVSQENQPYNVLRIHVYGTHSARRVVYGIRNYYVVAGAGSFTLAGVEHSVEAGVLIVINPGDVYSYTGEMELLEFNIPTEGKIEHEDVM